ncbi:hypothetical protein, partial [Klebsiella pneumoniae]|uniref:hypothetical protein n=1 Tax=Klebsiella pneumoniae TaxID=573 RepID=UPI001E5D2CEB
MRTKPSRGFSLLMAILFVVVLFLSFGVGFLSYINSQTYSNCLVDSKDRAASSDGGSDMRVYSSCGVFTVQDMPINGEFDSANT